MKKQKKNNFIVLKTLLCLILLGAIAFGIFAYRFGRVLINVSSETGELKVNDILCKISGMDKEVEFSSQPFSNNTYYGYAKVYTHNYNIFFELDNQPYELCLTHCSANPNNLVYVANVKIIVNVLEDGRIEITATENGERKRNEIFEKDDELYIYMGRG